MLTVLHADSLRLIDTIEEIRKAYKNDEYNVVANVDTDNIDEAYKLTNSINCGWWENDKVAAELNGKKGLRSTSVGDLILDENDNYFVVADFGFDKIRLPHPTTIG